MIIDDHSLYEMNDGERTAYRARNIGFVFQSYYLLPYLTVLENILVAAPFQKKKADAGEARLLAASLGLEGRLDHKPSELSAGEKQRVALARALISKPGIIFADEPTGNLDRENAHVVIERLAHFNREGGTVVMVSHDNEADEAADDIITLEKGALTTSNPIR